VLDIVPCLTAVGPRDTAELIHPFG